MKMALDSIINYNNAKSVLQQLIRIRTPQPNGDELDVAKYIVSNFHNSRFENRIVHHGENRASLVTTIKGNNPGKRVAIIGNMDTVSLDDTQTWKHPPFGADQEGDLIFGRGAANNKGGITMMILLALALVEEKELSIGDVLFCFTADGDKGGIGAKTLVEGGFLEKIDEIIFVNPTNCQLGVAEKGVIWLEIDIKGKTAHITQPQQGQNALDAFLLLHNRLSSLLKTERKHKFLGVPTCHITKIEARGFTVYSIPNIAKGMIDIRYLPSLDAEKFYSQIQDTAKKIEKTKQGLKIEIKVVNHRPAVAMEPTAPFISRLGQVLQEAEMNSKKVGLLFFTDASIIVPKIGAPFAILGPGKDIYCKPIDESVDLSSIIRLGNALFHFLQS